MHRFILSATILTAATLVVFVAVPSAQSAPQSKSKTAKVSAKPSTPAPPAYGNADAISEHELETYLYFIASDQLEGRNLPSRGYDIAALYVASHLAEWGLKPAGSATGTKGPLQPYLMPIELETKSVVVSESKISFTAPPGRGGRGFGGGGGGGGGNGGRRGGEAAEPRTTEFEYGRDWTVAGGGRGGAPLEAFDVAGKLAFVGNGYIINKTNTDPYQGLDVKGRIVVVAGLPAELAAMQNAGRGGGGRGQNPLGEACKDFMNPEEAAAKNGALAVITIPNFQQLAAETNPNAGGGGRGGPNGPAYQVPKLHAAAACPSVPAISAGLSLTNALFQGEKQNAQQIFYGAGSNAKQDSFDMNAVKNIKLHVAVKSEQGHGENVVAILEGGDPVKRNEFVVMSAHLDHIG
ncbi:MAG TPA: hypothetical protein VKS01_11050, partial [Bryobacteraceae bacterium]|nr:hypothetical protein [Bryobacteraceae bacterium]